MNNNSYMFGGNYSATKSAVCLNISYKKHLSSIYRRLLFIEQSFSHTHQFARLPVSVSADKTKCSAATLTAK